jgi:hypothetical protein
MVQIHSPEGNSNRKEKNGRRLAGDESFCIGRNRAWYHSFASRKGLEHDD